MEERFDGTTPAALGEVFRGGGPITNLLDPGMPRRAAPRRGRWCSRIARSCDSSTTSDAYLVACVAGCTGDRDRAAGPIEPRLALVGSLPRSGCQARGGRSRRGRHQRQGHSGPSARPTVEAACHRTLLRGGFEAHVTGSALAPPGWFAPPFAWFGRRAGAASARCSMRLLPLWPPASGLDQSLPNSGCRSASAHGQGRHQLERPCDGGLARGGAPQISLHRRNWPLPAGRCCRTTSTAVMAPDGWRAPAPPECSERFPDSWPGHDVLLEDHRPSSKPARAAESDSSANIARSIARSHLWKRLLQRG